MKKWFRKPTLILFLSSILLLIGIPSGIYGLTLDGGASLGGALILLAEGIVLVALFIDRALVDKVSPLRLSIYELVFLLLGITVYLYSERTIIVDIKNENSEYLFVIENPGNLENDESVAQFPFNRKIASEKNYVIVDKMANNIDFNINADWDSSYYYNIYEFEKYPRVKFFSKTDLSLIEHINQNLINSLINQK